jgi:hypothetical protein
MSSDYHYQLFQVKLHCYFRRQRGFALTTIFGLQRRNYSDLVADTVHRMIQAHRLGAGLKLIHVALGLTKNTEIDAVAWVPRYNAYQRRSLPVRSKDTGNVQCRF